MAAWAAEPQAQAFPVIAALSAFGQTDQTMTLELIGDAAGKYIQPLAPILPFAIDKFIDGGGLVAALQQSADRFGQRTAATLRRGSHHR